MPRRWVRRRSRTTSRGGGTDDAERGDPGGGRGGGGHGRRCGGPTQGAVATEAEPLSHILLHPNDLASPTWTYTAPGERPAPDGRSRIAVVALAVVAGVLAIALGVALLNPRITAVHPGGERRRYHVAREQPPRRHGLHRARYVRGHRARHGRRFAHLRASGDIHLRIDGLAHVVASGDVKVKGDGVVNNDLLREGSRPGQRDDPHHGDDGFSPASAAGDREHPGRGRRAGRRCRPVPDHASPGLVIRRDAGDAHRVDRRRLAAVGVAPCVERDVTPERPASASSWARVTRSGEGLLRFVLEGEGFLVLADASTAVELVQALAVHRPEAVILDDAIGTPPRWC